MQSDYGKVAVLMGGQSSERAISLESGRAVLASLHRSGVDARAVDVDCRALQTIVAEKFDRAFIMLHGRGGEDGLIQGGLEHLGIPYTGSGVLGSALAMDKIRSKQLWKQHGLPTPDYEELCPDTDWDSIPSRLGLPLMIKPVREGSSIGLYKVSQKEQLASAWRKAVDFDQRVMVEHWVQGYEYTVPVLDNQALPLIKLETDRAFYDYVAKYEDQATRYICPCGLSETMIHRIQTIALQACACLDVSGWGRVDIILNDDHIPWLIEVNTVPGMTASSLVPMGAKEAGINFDRLVLKILDTSMVQRG